MTAFGKGEAATALAGASTASLEEADLIRAAQKGDQAAFESLVRAHDQDVLRLAGNLLRNEQDAYDIYQETFLRVYRNLNSFRFNCGFRTWLYRIVTNLCLDHLRRKKVRREEPAKTTTPEGELDLLAGAQQQNPAGDPQRNCMSAQLRLRIESALEQLTPRERVVFELRHFHGMRLRAIGEAVGSTEEAAKNCLFRATQKMRAALGDFL